ncbi:MAG: molybdenum cofactor guanylyltransferase [Anaerolineae bacterium]|nr:MAG: molybdenum cofactor guanylyltransferase [Anaerolineae bacterium]
MGRDKALIPLGGMPLIEHVLRRVEGLGDEVLITTNRPEDYAFLGMRLVEDRRPGAGALHGLLTALEAARGERVLLVGCDMPFVNRSLLEHMLAISTDAEVVIPRRGGKLQPLHAIYSKTCAGLVSQALEAGEKRMISFFPRLQTWIIEQETLDQYDPDGLSFFNANTPEELAQAERLLGEVGL